MKDQDVTVKFHRSQWWNIPESVQILIGQLCGPLYPDKDDVLTITLSESQWHTIWDEIEKLGRED